MDGGGTHKKVNNRDREIRRQQARDNDEWIHGITFPGALLGEIAERLSLQLDAFDRKNGDRYRETTRAVSAYLMTLARNDLNNSIAIPLERFISTRGKPGLVRSLKSNDQEDDFTFRPSTDE